MGIRHIFKLVSSIFWIGVIAWQVVSFLRPGGADDGSEGRPHRAIVDERDGTELVALMRGAREAVISNDADGFERLFTEPGAGKSAWVSVQRYARESGAYLTDVVTTPPEVERTVTDVHVRALRVEAWYDFRHDHTVAGTPVHHTTWQFHRTGDGWTLARFKIDTSLQGYDDTIPVLLSMTYHDLMRLDMDWEESVDPTPAVARALRAAARKDAGALQRCSARGVFLQMHDKEVELPGEYGRSRYSGGYNTTYAEKKLHRQISKLQRRSRTLETSPTGLIPFFTAYRVVSMPAECTQLKIRTDFDGDEVPAPVGGFRVEWKAAFVAHKWLVNSMDVQTVSRWSHTSLR